MKEMRITGGGVNGEVLKIYDPAFPMSISKFLP